MPSWVTFAPRLAAMTLTKVDRKSMRTLRPHFSSILCRRIRYAATIFFLAAASLVIFLLVAQSAETFRGDLLMNLGATIFGAVATASILEPLIDRSRKPEVVVHRTFPHELFLDAAAGAIGRIRIMGAWPYGMELPYRGRYLAVLQQAMASGVPVQILILDPASSAAQQRTSDMRDGDASETIHEVLLAFKAWVDTLSGRTANHLEIKIFSALPPARLYLAGRKVVCSFFGDSDSRDGSNVRHYETSTLGGLGLYVNEAFDQLWSSEEALTLEEYWQLDMEVRFPADGGPVPDRHRVVGYVAAAGGLFVSDQQLLHDIGHHEIPVRLRRRIEGFDWDGNERLRLRAFDRSRDPRSDVVISTANSKYGDENNVRRSFVEVRAET
ncbi:hypothetical protein Ga0074812_1323 [Parafrankia irregularis]|uniref:Uncharacterized protein n=1 Tax=Parafrankia irregularis TaxID=795642 RepID=A0A0S4QZ19_9ACTN|nr:hypothetical protein Ga0074812_1323 [Parafrankia irregularis]